MKPSQQLQIAELSKCYMTRGETEWVQKTQTLIRWGEVTLDRWATEYLPYLWNKYRMQIRHNRKMVKHGN